MFVPPHFAEAIDPSFVSYPSAEFALSVGEKANVVRARIAGGDRPEAHVGRQPAPRSVPIDAATNADHRPRNRRENATPLIAQRQSPRTRGSVDANEMQCYQA